MTTEVSAAFVEARSPKNLRRAALAGGVGTALEQFDFASYGLAAALAFPGVFFPGSDPLAGALKAFLSYAVGFFARPIGGFIFSHFGEKMGRKWVLFGTLALMGSATFLMGCLPSYNTLGRGAVILLTILRILQGCGAGAEQAGSGTMLTETAKIGGRGRLSASVMVGAAGGTVLGTLVFAIVQACMTHAQFISWGWRIVFWVSILVTLGGFWIRRHLAESPVFAELKASAAETEREKAPLVQAVRFGWPTMLRVFFINWGQNINSYIVQTFFVTFVTTTVVVGHSGGKDVFFASKTMTDIELVGAVIGMATAFLWGWLSDKTGRKPLTGWLTGLEVVLPFLYFPLLKTGNTALVCVAVFIGFAFSAYGVMSVQFCWLPELFGSRYRYAGMTVARELSAAIGGGLAPFICAALVEATKSWIPAAVYAAITMGVSLIAVCLSPETIDRDLTIPTDAVKGEARTGK